MELKHEISDLTSGAAFSAKQRDCILTVRNVCPSSKCKDVISGDVGSVVLKASLDGFVITDFWINGKLLREQYSAHNSMPLPRQSIRSADV